MMKETVYLIQNIDEDGDACYYVHYSYSLTYVMKYATRYKSLENANKDLGYVKENTCGETAIVEAWQDEQSFRLELITPLNP